MLMQIHTIIKHAGAVNYKQMLTYQLIKKQIFDIMYIIAKIRLTFGP